ncbi:MAG: DUF2027 domain-containing protein [Bacteroides sp.]|nr:DUF2027 domain-containing protein [Roseburia sp.]MCM1347539.1 DUF2027 domain-containing protein [Bacteroides sp.]MCM1421986.1 DUF2027 domain-containing protein [Bacteroides sp.]
MKIGDKVRFLSDVGGGIVRKFEKGNMVLVEDEDGFEIPALISECVVIDTDDYNIAKVDTIGRKKQDKKTNPHPATTVSVRTVAQQPDMDEEEEEKQVTFKPKPEERKDGDKLNVCLAFVPKNVKEISSTVFDTYIVNDSNFFINYTYMSAENSAWRLRSTGVIEPNTKLHIEDITHSMLNDIERVAIQFIAYKEDKTFLMKPAVGMDMRIDTTKFYKLHTFRESIFFNEPALVYDIIKDDIPSRPLVVNAAELKKAMYEKAEVDKPQRSAARATKKEDKNAVVEIDLHADELLETTAGMSAADIKEYQLNIFRRTMEEHIKEKGRRIVFIHGKGEGVLRSAIIAELKHKYKSCTYQDASFQQYGFGATMVIIH